MRIIKFEFVAKTQLLGYFYFLKAPQESYVFTRFRTVYFISLLFIKSLIIGSRHKM